MTKTDASRKRFLKAFAECGVIGEAALLAKVARRSHYAWLAEPEYVKAFEEAKEEAADRLEAELYDRIYNGTEEPVVYQGELCYKKDRNGKITGQPLTIRRKNDTLLIFALKGARPDRYRENFHGELNVKGAITIRDPNLAQLTDEQLQALEAITLAATQKLQ